MHFAVFRRKPGFSFAVLLAAFLFIASITIGTVSSSASSEASRQKSEEIENAGFSENQSKNFSENKSSGRMTLKEVSNSAENIAASPVFEQFDRWLKSNSSDNFASAEQLENGVNLAIEREQLLKQLIVKNPRLALEKSVSTETFESLPAKIAAHTEKRVSAYGDFMVYVLENIDRKSRMMTESRVERSVVIGDARYEAFVYGRREGMTTKLNIPLQGIVIGDKIALDENPARKIENPGAYKSDEKGVAAEIGGEIVQLASEAALDDLVHEQVEWESKIGPVRQSGDGTEKALASTWTEGAKKVLVIRVDTPEKQGEPVDFYNQPLTLTRAQSLFTSSVSPFFANSSYNKTSLEATVTPVVRLPQSLAYYATGTNYNVMLTDARNAARAAGFNTDNYNLDIVTFSYTSSLGWAGLAAVGGKANLLNGAFFLPETSHELGHNYGLFHANFYRTTDGTTIGTGANVEYGDCYDNMGACYNGDLTRHFNARYKRLLDWLTDADVQTVTSDGTYRIYAQDSTQASGIRALKIAKGTTKNYWVEFRQLIGGNAQNGALIRWDYSSQNFRETQLLDMTPNTATTRMPTDEPLAIGQSFYDSANQIKITVVGKGNTSPESLDVKVEFNPGSVTPTCTYAISPGSQSFDAAGGSGSVSVTTSAGCTWTASSNQSFAAITSSGSGSGSGSVAYTVAANSTTSSRSAAMTIAGQTFTIQQTGATSATYTLVASPSTVAAGGTVTVNFTAPAGSSYYDWVGLFRVGAVNTDYISGGYTTGGTAGTFNVVVPVQAGSYEFRYLLNNGYTSVKTSNVIYVQAAQCSYSVTPGSQSFGSEGGAGSVTVTAGSNCSWGAGVNSSWVSMTSATGGSGTGAVSYIVQPNTGAARSETLTIAGQTFTVNQAAAAVPSLYNLSGSVTYAGTPSGQTPRYISGVTMHASGTSTLSALTDEYGSYLLQGLSGVGTYTVTPSKAPDVSAVSSFDASLASRYAAGLVALTPNQALAADVSGNGSVSSYDAALIAKTAGNIGNEGIAGRWKFTPTSRSYANLTNHQSNQNYEAVLMGDVSGNWTAQNSALASAAYLSEEERSAADKAEEAEYQAAQSSGGAVNDAAYYDRQEQKAADETESAVSGGNTVDIPDNLAAANGSTVLVPVNISDVAGQGIISYSLTLSFNQNVLQLAASPFETSGTRSSSYTITPNTATPGQINIQAFGTTDLSGSGTLIFLRFNVIGNGGTTSNLSLNSFMFNEGSPASSPSNGLFTVAAPPTAATVSVSGRVTTAQGRGVRNVQITLIDANGNRRTAQTTSFGYYRFDDIAAGETVTLTARAKRFSFAQPVIVRSVNEQINNADFVTIE